MSKGRAPATAWRKIISINKRNVRVRLGLREARDGLYCYGPFSWPRPTTRSTAAATTWLIKKFPQASRAIPRRPWPSIVATGDADGRSVETRDEGEAVDERLPSGGTGIPRRSVSTILKGVPVVHAERRRSTCHRANVPMVRGGGWLSVGSLNTSNQSSINCFRTLRRPSRPAGLMARRS